MSKRLRYAVLGYKKHQSFGDGGHQAYWDGWYESRELAEDAARSVMQHTTSGNILFSIVEHVEEVTP